MYGLDEYRQATLARSLSAIITMECLNPNKLQTRLEKSYVYGQSQTQRLRNVQMRANIHLFANQVYNMSFILVVGKLNFWPSAVVASSKREGDFG